MSKDTVLGASRPEPEANSGLWEGHCPLMRLIFSTQSHHLAERDRGSVVDVCKFRRRLQIVFLGVELCPIHSLVQPQPGESLTPDLLSR